MSTALYVGTFDPFTLGHYDVIDFCLNQLQVTKLIIGVGINCGKTPIFLAHERVAMIEEVCKDDRVVIEAYETMTADFAKKHNVDFLVRGVRDGSDCTSELKYAQTIETLWGLRTVIVATKPTVAHISSTLVREIFKFKGMSEELKMLVPNSVLLMLKARGEE